VAKEARHVLIWFEVHETFGVRLTEADRDDVVRGIRIEKGEPASTALEAFFEFFLGFEKES
jgi:hypothetical protein